MERMFVRSIKNSSNFSNKYKTYWLQNIFLEGKQTVKINEVVKTLLEMRMNQAYTVTRQSLKIKHIIILL